MTNNNNTPFNQKEFDKYRAAISQLSNLKAIPLMISEQAAYCIIAQLQLAFRHPNNNSVSRDVVREAIQPIVEYFTGDVREILERGFHPEFDCVVNPDPVWEYHQTWQSLQEIKDTLGKTESGDGEIIVLPKDACVVNSLAMGIAIQILAQKTGMSIEGWKQHLAQKAFEQYRQLTSQEIQQIVVNIELAVND